MSVDLTESVWRSRARLRGREKIVLLRIADRINRQNGVAWPSVKSLADDCGLSRGGTRAALARLIAGEYLIVERDHSGRRSRRYQINLNKLCRGSLFDPLQTTDPLDRRGSLETVEGQNGTRRGSKSTPEPKGTESTEPQVQKITGAVAPAVSLDKVSRCLLPLADVEVYLAIARAALDCAVRERDDTSLNVRAHVQRLCAERQVRYDPCVAGRAIDEAWRILDAARGSFVDEHRRKGG